MPPWAFAPRRRPRPRLGRGQKTKDFTSSRFMDALKKSRRREGRLVIARHAHLLPLDHPWRNGPLLLETMKRYLIERGIPKVGSLSREEYRALAATSPMPRSSSSPGWCNGCDPTLQPTRAYPRLVCPKAKRWFANIRALPAFR